MKGVQFVLDLIDKITPGALKIVRALAKVDKAMMGIDRRSMRVRNTMANFFDNANQRARAFGNTLTALPRLIFSLPALIATSVIGLGIGSVIDAASFKSSTLTGFEMMFNDNQVASDFYDKMIQYANQTPFGTRDVMEIGKMLSQKFSPTQIPTLMAGIGDIGAANNFNTEYMDRMSVAFLQMSGGKLKAQDIGQMRDAMAPVGEMWKVLGEMHDMTVQEVMKLQELVVSVVTLVSMP